MLTYDLSRRGRLSRYDYLYRCIKDDILTGRIKAGERLPSKRILAQHLETAVVTVENAYGQLIAEGYVSAKEKRGYYVNQMEKRKEPDHEVGKKQTIVSEQVKWQFDLKGEGSGAEGFPFSVWAKLMRQVLTEEGERLLQALPHSGVMELRRAIARHVYQFRGIAAQPEQIVVGAGTEYLYNLLVQLLGRDQIYGIEDPGYSKAVKIYQLNGASCVSIPVDEKGAQPDAVEQSDVQVLHISPNHQFPTGTVMPIARRQRLLNWAKDEPRRYIIEDDYDSEFRFTGLPIPTMQSIDTGGRVIYINTFSRSLAPSLRISYMILPEGLLTLYQSRLGFYSCTVPAIEQYTLARFLEEGRFEAHINRMRGSYRSRRDTVLTALRNSSLAGKYRVVGENAGLHFLVVLDTGKSDDELVELAKRRGIRLAFLSQYQIQPGAASAHVLVVNYPGIDLPQWEQALEELAILL
ncbi:MAG: PLP-dependent aminotransferase family protein [Lawsonibacter sp.]|jgi:GntR family transcriptional regulator/MocR family aminotransferase